MCKNFACAQTHQPQTATIPLDLVRVRSVNTKRLENIFIFEGDLAQVMLSRE